MTSFDEIPNKQEIEKPEVKSDVWPELGENFELNQFYRTFSCAEGWIGDAYLALWSRQEICDYRLPNFEAYPEEYHFFASDVRRQRL